MSSSSSVGGGGGSGGGSAAVPPHRKSSSLNRSWFEGTMEVISGMAPRPVTPSGHSTTSFPQQRPVSAPNSPARGYGSGKPNDGNGGGGFGFGSIINRLPSQDSLDRSIHNESGHGKSTAQIVRDLKHANSSLSAKMASMEKKHMNELSDITRSFEKKQVELESSIKSMKKHVQQLESSKSSAEYKLKEKEVALSKVKEESAFQRHTISGLKNDLYQLQSELDELEDNEQQQSSATTKKRSNNKDDNSSPSLSTTADQQQIEELKIQLERYQGYETMVEELQQQLDEANRKVEAASSLNSSFSRNIRPPLAPSSSRDVADTSNDTDGVVADLEEKLKTKTQEWNDREADLLARLDQKANVEKQLEEKSEVMVELEEKLDQYTEKLGELATALAEARQSAKNQEQYRRDEAEDLRILHDAQEEQITKLQKELDNAQQEVELRDQELEELKKNYSSLSSSTKPPTGRSVETEDEKKVEDSDEDNSMLKDAASISTEHVSQKVVMDLEEQLYNSTETVNKLEQQIEDLKNSNAQSVESLQKEKADLEVQLQHALSGNTVVTDGEFTNLKAHWENKTTAVAEVDRLNKEVERLLQKVHESSEAQKASQKQVEQIIADRQEMETQLAASATLKDQHDSQNQVVAEINKEFELAKEELTRSNDEIVRLQKLVADLQNRPDETTSIKRQLEEAQIALVALDEEKKQVTDALKSEISEKEKELSNLREMAQSTDDAKSDDKSTELEGTVSSLYAQNEMLQTKLKDRDTTIATLVRSSVGLEKKIGTLEAELQASKSRGENENGGHDDVSNAQRSNNTRDDDKLTSQLNYLKKELRVAKADAKRWKRALNDDQTPGSDYRMQISMLQKANEDYSETIQERDQAIQNLVNQSMSQEAHVRDLKTRVSTLMKEVETVRMEKERVNDVATVAEMRRLQEEACVFAGQVIEQDEELKRMQRELKSRDEKVLALKRELGDMRLNFSSRSVPIVEDPGLLDELKATQSILASRESQIAEQQVQISDLTRQAASVGDLKAELDEMQDAAESNRTELRDLRKQLWEAKDSLGSTNDLRLELEQAQYALSEFKRKHSSSNSLAEEERAQFAEVLKENADLLERKNEMESRIRDLETQLKEKEALEEQSENNLVEIESRIDETKALQDELNKTRKELEEARSKAQESVSVADSIKEELASVTHESASHSNKLKASLDEIEVLKVDLEKKQAIILSNNESISKLEASLHNADSQLKEMEREASEQSKAMNELRAMKATLIAEVSDSQARLGAMERELSQTASSNSSNEELLQRINSLVVENASLLQKNEALGSTTTELNSTISKLEDQVSNVTNDNKDLCGELQTLGSSYDDLKKIHSSLKEDLGSEKAAQDKETNDLRRQISSMEESATNLRSENDKLSEKIKALEEAKSSIIVERDSLAQQQDASAVDTKSLKEENESLAVTVQQLQDKNSVLSQRTDEMSHEIERLSKQIVGGDEYKKQLDEALKARELTEKSIIELSAAKDSEITSLQQKLADSRGRTTEEMEEVLMQMKAMEEEAASMQEQYELELQAKDQQVYALESTLHAQENIVNSMRAEMDQLQSGMEHATMSRRGEMEAVQQELMQVEARAMRHEREIVGFKMQIEEMKLEHKAEVVQLKDALAAANQDSPLKKTISDLHDNDRMLEVRERLEQLKARNTQLQEENIKLGGRLERAAIQINSFELEKKHAADTEEENVKLRHQLKEYEQLLSRSTSKSGSLPLSAKVPTVDSHNPKFKEKQKKKGFGLFGKRRNEGNIVAIEESEEEV